METEYRFEEAAIFFGALGHMLYEYPRKDFYDGAISEAFFSNIPFGCGATFKEGAQLLCEWQDEAAQDPEEYFGKLTTDYQDLFIGVRGKVKTPPWESVYMSPEPILFGRSALDARLWYDRFGLKITKLGKEPDDHIGIEFVFMAQLFSKKEYSEAAAFFGEHLGCWYEKFFKNVSEQASSKFYKGMAILATGACQELAELLAEKTNELQML